jgi:hypothetical protein
MRKLVQLGRDDERQEEEDRDADGQGVVGLYRGLPVGSGNLDYKRADAAATEWWSNNATRLKVQTITDVSLSNDQGELTK